MELNFMREAVAYDEIVFDGSTEQPITCDMVLPDYCPEISRILKCTVNTNISSTQVTGNRITAEGIAIVRAIYVSPENKLCGFDQSYPFSKYVEVKAMPQSPVISVKAKTQYVNARAVSQRRLDIHGTVSLSFCVRRIRDESCVSSVQSEGLQTLCSKTRTATVAGCAVRSMSVGEVAELPPDKPPIGCILRTQSSEIISDVKIINNKLLIKGEIIITVLYCGDNSQVCRFVHSMPLSQIADVDGVSDTCTCRVSLDTAALDVTPRKGSNGEQRQLDINCRLNACVEAVRETELNCVDDAYSTLGELLIERKGMDIYKPLSRIDETVSIACELDFSGTEPKEIVDSWCTDITAMTPEVSPFEICGTATVSMIYADAEGQLCFGERQADYRIKKDFDFGNDKIRCFPQAKVTAISCTPSGSGATARLEICFSGDVYAVEQRQVISSLEADDSVRGTKRQSAIIVYFCDAGEKLWDISKKYNSTIELIKCNNGLEQDVTEKKCMLLIPVV